jgi:hypothetical protein
LLVDWMNQPAVPTVADTAPKAGSTWMLADPKVCWLAREQPAELTPQLVSLTVKACPLIEASTAAGETVAA